MGVITTIDFTILHFIKDHTRNKVLDKTMPIISRLGDFGLIWICSALSLLAFPHYRRYVPFFFFSLIASFLIGEVVLKTLIGRTRPCNIESVSLLINQPQDFSFPSGHSMSSFAVSTFLWHINHDIGNVAIVMATLIALSRLYLFVHYPTDVIAGSILGRIVGYLFYHLTIMVY